MPGAMPRSAARREQATTRDTVRSRASCSTIARPLSSGRTATSRWIGQLGSQTHITRCIVNLQLDHFPIRAAATAEHFDTHATAPHP
jgi:hypothetical protein